MVLSQLSIEDVWSKETGRERRVLVETVALFPDHLEVTISGAPKMNITLQEVGLSGGLSTRGVGRTAPRDGNDLEWRVGKWIAG